MIERKAIAQPADGGVGVHGFIVGATLWVALHGFATRRVALHSLH